jgi:hypothetical protein
VPGYELMVNRRGAREELRFRPRPHRRVAELISDLAATLRSGDKR